MGEHFFRSETLGAVLEEGCSGGSEFCGEVAEGGGEALRRDAAGAKAGIEDGVKAREMKEAVRHDQGSETHICQLQADMGALGVYFPALDSAALFRKRSMNLVSKFPARKSASLIIRRCKGMVV